MKASTKNLHRQEKALPRGNPFRPVRRDPASGHYGLPGIKLRLSFQYAPEQYDVVEKALWKVASQIEGPLGGQKPAPQAALFFVAQRIIDTDPVGSDRV